MPRPTTPRAASPTASAGVGMGVDRFGDVVEGETGLRRQHELVHQLGHVGPDEIGAMTRRSSARAMMRM